MIISQNGAVDLIPEYNRALRPIFCVSEGDANSRTINLTVTSAGEVFTIPEGAEVYVAGKKQDNTIFTYQCAYSGYIVSFPIAEQMSAANGLVLCELQIVVAGDPLGSANFCYWVEPSPIANGSSSESDLNIFEQAIAALGGYEYLTSEVSVLSARMDQFARLPDGSLSTSADAELADVRVKADGTTAATAGNAVREQITELKSKITETTEIIDEITEQTGAINLYNSATDVSGTMYSNGDIGPSTDWMASDYIDVEGLDYITVQIKTTKTVGAGYSRAFYNAEKVSTGDGSGRVQDLKVGGDVDVPSDLATVLAVPAWAKYFRFLYAKDNISTNQIMVEAGDTPHKYVPYGSGSISYAVKLPINYGKMFHRVGVLGDSLSSGEISYTSAGSNLYVDKYEYSWLSNLCRSCGTEAVHYSRGGLTTKNWLDDVGGKRTALNNDTPCNAYFIAFGTNDIRSGMTLGSSTDMAGTDTFVGYIKQIIELVHAKAPNGAVFLMSTYSDSAISRTWSKMIEAVANLYSYCYYVDFVNYTEIYTTSPAPYTSLGHFTTPAYVEVANTINKLVNNIVKSNYADFMLFAVNN